MHYFYTFLGLNIALNDHITLDHHGCHDKTYGKALARLSLAVLVEEQNLHQNHQLEATLHAL